MLCVCSCTADRSSLPGGLAACCCTCPAVTVEALDLALSFPTRNGGIAKGLVWVYLVGHGVRAGGRKVFVLRRKE